VTRIKTTLISVSDKTGLAEFAARLKALDIDILSTGGTARLLKDSGIEVMDVSEYTGFPEILDGRVKTLHPKVHGGLLALRDKMEHRKEMDRHGIRAIDMVVVNLYPFEHTVSRPGVELAEAIENIDIGGPTMIRSAAKNYTHVAVVTRPSQYDAIAKELEQGNGSLSEKTHFRLAVEAFGHTARYDRAIVNYLRGLAAERVVFEDALALEFRKRQELRYGENPHQRAAFYVEEGHGKPCVSTARQIAGPELSFNNILDLNAALELVKEFSRPAAVIIKHANPCGAAIADTLQEAYRKAYLGDPVSAFGSVLALNRSLDAACAELVAEFRAEGEAGAASYFVEVIAAPHIAPDALRLLHEKTSWGKRTRLLETGELAGRPPDASALDMRRVGGGLLVQEPDLRGFEEDSINVVTELSPTEGQMADLRFAWICCKHVKSNAIVLARDQMIVGVGAGQMSRLDSCIIAARKAAQRAQGAVLASDAFFPFPDAVEAAAEAGVKAIIQPGGSKKDNEVIAAANRHNIAMLLTGVRHFRH